MSLGQREPDSQAASMAPTSPVPGRTNGSASGETVAHGFTALNVNDRPSPPNVLPSAESNGLTRSANREGWPPPNGDSNHAETPNRRRYIDADTNDPTVSASSPLRARAHPIDVSDIDPRVVIQSQPGAPRDPRWDPDESRMADLLRQETDSRMELSSPDTAMRAPGSAGSASSARSNALVTTNAGVQQDLSKKRKRAFTNRTKTGCQTCRKRKKKCDEGKPECQNCLRGGFNCLGYAQRRDVSGKHGPMPLKAVIPLQSRPYWERGSRSSPHGGYDTNGMSQQGTPDARPMIEDPSPNNRPFPPWSNTSAMGLPRTDRVPDFRSLPPIYNSRAPPSFSPMIGQSTDAADRARAALRVGWENNRTSPLPGTENGDPGYGGNMGLFKPNEPIRTMRRKACMKSCNAFNNSATNNVSEGELMRMFSQIIHPEQSSGSTSTVDPHTQKNRLGKDVRVEAPFKAEYGENLHIGDGVSIDTGCYFKDAYGMFIANNTRIGANVTISAEWVPPDPQWRDWSRGVTVRIGENVYIGPGVLISPSGPVFKHELVIGDNAYIAAGTIVTKDIPKGAYIMPTYTFSTAEELGAYDERGL